MSTSRLALASASALALVLAGVAACSTNPKPTPATTPAPAAAPAATPAAAAGAPAPIDRQRCMSLMSPSRGQCGVEQQAAVDWCMALGRLAEAGSCVAQATRAFECAARTSTRCEGAACCTANRECDDVNVAFDHCARGYCGGHSGNPDCRWFDISDTSPISFTSPKRPSAPVASLAPANPADPAWSTDPDEREDLDTALRSRIRKIDDTHYEIKSSLVDRILLNPMAVAKGARVVPSVKDGKPNGFKLYAIRPASLYLLIGLQNGDTVESVNGQLLDSADKALDVYTTLRSAKRIELGLIRRGKPLALTIKIVE